MFSVLKKELKGYFLTTSGYIYIGVFMMILSVFFYKYVFSYRSANYSSMFYDAATLITFLAPILTMRMFAEERKLGTYQLLMTSPRSSIAIVLGKFFAALVVVLIAELCTFMYYGILEYFGTPNLILSLNTLLAFFLLSMAYLSLGMFISSMTENQIIAAVVTITTFLIMWFIPTPNELFLLVYKYNSFLEGTINISYVVTFLSFTLLCIVLTIVAIQRRKAVK